LTGTACRRGRAPGRRGRLGQPGNPDRAAPLDGACAIEISTAAHGFGATWEAVMRDFHQRWQLADVRVSINDMGATPAVVSLRWTRRGVDQAG
jgi:citrate lyase gamma subunit